MLPCATLPFCCGGSRRAGLQPDGTTTCESPVRRKPALLLLFGLRRWSGNRASFTAKVEAERERMRALVRSCEAESSSRRVLIHQPRALEDSSRNWTVWMMLDHLRRHSTFVDSCSIAGAIHSQRHPRSLAQTTTRREGGIDVCLARKSSTLPCWATVAGLRNSSRHIPCASNSASSALSVSTAAAASGPEARRVKVAPWFRFALSTPKMLCAEKLLPSRTISMVLV